ncbi:UbiA family prenyltransferase [Lichenihabitans sp. Uapishka_5]|uniref:UbiA family prenyltransferase n=1 Tax=Lichenihabitans sp. Uapishka_5 TaxID=3037302 RepID=UPI0029E8027E|nr:UbiA family prenyltransferase [Lichenihabitans sp. Uapishka_5]MDX7952831.1 UbiA family prenyltransferase [Lichenihabitans sp. Uapishka_5]
MSGAHSGQSNCPLVVDLDGTLLRTDLLVESFFTLLSHRPHETIGALQALRLGRAALKAKLADQAVFEVASLPFNEEVLAYVVGEKAKGRNIYLASASDKRLVQSLADHLGIFDGVFGSEDGVNLAGQRKADLLCAIFGEGGFDYIGDAPVDEAVWRRARGVFLADARPSHLDAVRRWAPHAEAIGTRRSFVSGRVWLDYVRAMRLHQWLKNVLVLVPALAAHRLGGSFLASVLGFISFSLCASSVYILNDLLDLRSDRAHARKRLRPFAAGRIPLVKGALLFPALLASSLLVGLFLPWRFLLVLVGYYVLTCAYSFWLKRKTLVDVVTLACLYGTRLVAGSAAASIALSPWLVAFSIFIFFCLALVKRCAELVDSKARGCSGLLAGRGYATEDFPVLQAMSTASGFVSVLVLALYIDRPAIRALYSHPARLWPIAVLLLYWVSRTILMTHRGLMHDDPVVFAVKDRTSLLVALACVLLMAASI